MRPYCWPQRIAIALACAGAVLLLATLGGCLQPDQCKDVCGPRGVANFEAMRGARKARATAACGDGPRTIACALWDGELEHWVYEHITHPLLLAACLRRHRVAAGLLLDGLDVRDVTEAGG